MWRQYKHIIVYTYTNPTITDLSFSAAGGDHLEPVVEPVAGADGRASARHRLGKRSD